MLPASVTINPLSADLTIGDDTRFSVRILDANGRDIPNVSLRWTVLTGIGNTSNAASIYGGQVYALAEGDLIVRATYSYGTYIPGFENEIQAGARLTIRPPKHFSTVRLPRPAGPPGGAVFRYKTGQIFARDDGTLLFPASLSSWAMGIGILEKGAASITALAGQPGVTQSSYVYDFARTSMNGKGQIIAQASMIGSNNVLFKGDRNGLASVVWENTVNGGYVTSNNHRISRQSLGADGGFAFFANYLDSDPPVSRSGIFRINADLTDSFMVASNRDAWPELGGPPAFDSDTIALAGTTTYFAAYNGAQRGLYRQSGYKLPEKLLATGDPFLESTVASFHSWPMQYVSASGDVVFGVTLANGLSFLVLAPGGDLSLAKSTRVSSWTGVYGVNPSGVLAMITPFDKPYGLYLWKNAWKDADLQEIYVSGRTQVNGGTIQAMQSAAMDAQGRVTALIQTGNSPWMLAGFDGTPQAVLKDGDAYGGDVRPAAWGIVQGGKGGSFHFITAGDGGGIWEWGIWEGKEGFRPVAETGQRLAPAQVFTGGAPWNTRRGPDGAIYLAGTSGYGIARVMNGKTDLAAPCGRRAEDGATLGCPYEVRVNSSGEMLLTQGTDKGDTRLALVRGDRIRTVVSSSNTSVDGFGIVTSWSDQVLDESGRVGAILYNARGDFGIYIWQDGVWQKAARPGDKIGRWNILSISNLKTGGSRFYARVQAPGGGWAIAEFGGGAPRILVDADEHRANGVPTTYIGLYDVNNNGDVLFQASGYGQTTYGVKRINGQMRHLYSSNVPTEDGDFLWRLVDFDLRDDGTVFSLWVNLQDEPVLYRSIPQ